MIKLNVNLYLLCFTLFKLNVNLHLLQEMVFKGRRPTDGIEVTVRVKLVKVLPHSGCVQLFNIMFRK